MTDLKELPEESKPRRITMRSMAEDVMSILNLERGWIYTLRELLLRPGAFLNEYFNVTRRKASHPLRFLFLSAALATFLSLNFVFVGDNFALMPNVNDDGSVSFSIEPRSGNKESLEEVLRLMPDEEHRLDLVRFIDRTTEVFSSALNTLFLLIAPIQAFFTWLFFRRKGYNFAEHLAANAFFVGWQNLAFCLLVPITMLNLRYAFIAALILSIMLTVMIVRSFRTKGVLRAITAAGMAVFFAAICFLSVIAILLNYAITSFESVN